MDLSVFYPHPRRAFLDPVSLAAIAGVIGTSFGAVAAWRKAPWLLVGWAWYLVMLLPVLGILQVGNQGMADRYTYLPGVGILLAGTWSAWAIIRGFPTLAVRAAATVAATAAILGLAFATRAGVPFWKDSEALFTNARAATGSNALASNALGTIAAGRGQFERAEWFFRESIAADPSFGIPRQNLAAMLLQQGRIAEGWPMALEAVRLDPSNARAHYVVGVGHEMQGRLAEAAAAYEDALRRMPEHGLARRRLAEVRAAMGSPARATKGTHP
jgi:tetratricopeptide (TPR) repeat protein